jgi:hypothetical protein
MGMTAWENYSRKAAAIREQQERLNEQKRKAEEELTVKTLLEVRQRQGR